MNRKKGYLTAKEVAREWRVNPVTVYELLRSGSLKGVRIGRCWRVRKSDLDSYLEKAHK